MKYQSLNGLFDLDSVETGDEKTVAPKTGMSSNGGPNSKTLYSLLLSNVRT